MRQSLEYRNKYMYFVVRRDEVPGVLIYCSGVNLFLFTRMTKGRHGQGPNPTVRGLQLTNLAIFDMALAKGASARKMRGNDCAGLAGTDDAWYSELIRVESAPDSFAREIIDSAPPTLLRKITKAVMLEMKVPERLPSPHECETFIDHYLATTEIRDLLEHP